MTTYQHLDPVRKAEVKNLEIQSQTMPFGPDLSEPHCALGLTNHMSNFSLHRTGFLLLAMKGFRIILF